MISLQNKHIKDIMLEIILSLKRETWSTQAIGDNDTRFLDSLSLGHPQVANAKIYAAQVNNPAIEKWLAEQYPNNESIEKNSYHEFVLNTLHEANLDVVEVLMSEACNNSPCFS